MMRNIFALLTCSAALLATGCASAPEPYAISYHSALEKQGSVDSEQAHPPELTNFIALFTNLQRPDLKDRVTDVYATDIYFNDTVHTLTSREALIAYLEQTAQRADLIDVRIDDTVTSGSHAYVRWTMRTVFTVAGKEKDIVTVGMTHLRFDNEGRVTLHQDFWDSTEGLFRHMPVVGGMINWIGKKL